MPSILKFLDLENILRNLGVWWGVVNCLIGAGLSCAWGVLEIDSGDDYRAARICLIPVNCTLNNLNGKW